MSPPGRQGRRLPVYSPRVPEGDTIHRLAERLRPVLVGQDVVEARSHVPAIRERHLAGHAVTSIDARGKNLLIHFDHGLTLHTHLRMLGAWHVYERGARWRQPLDRLRVALMTRAHEAVCFGAPVARMLRTDRLDADPALAALGPDLLAETFDAEDAVARLRALGELPIGVALLDQRALAGIGNVWKSELLFLARLHPETPVAALDDATLAALVDLARREMLRSVTKDARGGFALRDRVTRVTLASSVGRGGELWVYDRGGAPCLRCGAKVAVSQLGPDARVTYHCPRCQPELRYPPRDGSHRG